MIRHILLISFLIYRFDTLLGQSIKELENDLLTFRGSINYVDKIDKARKLHQLDPFNYTAARYICDYYQTKDIDSVSIFFDYLTARFSKSPKPYLLHYELLFKEYDYRERDNYNKQKIKLLTNALTFDSLNRETLFNLCKTYYEDFIYPYKRNKYSMFETDEDSVTEKLIPGITFEDSIAKKSTFDHSADSALVFFYRIWRTSKDLREIIYYPIRQLECYLNTELIPKDAELDFEQCFFPSFYFANLQKDWQYDMTTDYLFEIEMAQRKAEGLRQQLLDLKENCLYNLEISPSVTIYRFTWLRSFDNPISIRIERSDKAVTLYWKIGKGAGGYEPRGLKKAGKKKLKINDWTEFTNLATITGFNSLPNEKYVPMTDGATWTLERKTIGEFKAHNTNRPNKEFQNVCLYLLKKSNIKVKIRDIY